MKFRSLLLTFVFGILFQKTVGQIYPVQCTPQLVPPYSVYLADYATPGSERLRVILIQKDLTQPSYQLRLVMSIEWNGKVIMRTSRSFNPGPIAIDAGIPTIVSGVDLEPYLDSRNIDFIGYSREQYEKTRALPEGSYRVMFTAYDYTRQDVQVSNEGSSFYYLAKNEPPMINFPLCGTRVPIRNPQQIIFSWLPRNTSSPTSANDTEYEFKLYETRPPGRNPNDVLLTTPPVYEVITQQPQIVFGPAEPMLIEGMQYVWRVQARDVNGKDAFRNNGFSEVCTFTYAGSDVTFEAGLVDQLQAEGLTERSARIWWTTSELNEGYRIEYRKSPTKESGEYEWFKADSKNSEIKLYDLEPDMEYQARAQVIRQGVLGPYTDVVKFRTTPLRVALCGDAPVLANPTNAKPLQYATPGMFIQARGMELVLQSISNLGEDGWFKGSGRIAIPYLGGANFYAVFDRIYIDAERNVTAGRINIVTRGVAAMAEEQLAQQTSNQRKNKQEKNRDDWEGTDFYDQVFKYDDVISSVVIGADNELIVYDQNNLQQIDYSVAPILAASPEKAIIIEDKNGDQWVVQKDKSTGETKVTKVDGGGLVVGPDGKLLSNKQLSNLDRMILTSLRKYKKAIDDYLVSNKNAPGKKGGGPQVYDWETEAFYAIPQCLSDYTDKLAEIGDNLIPLQDSTRTEFKIFAVNVGYKIVAKDNATQEEVDVVVCGSIVDVRNYIDDLNCNPLLVPKALREIAARAFKCDDDVDDDIEDIPYADFEKLCVDQRIDLIRCIDDFPTQGADDETLIKILKSTPAGHRKKLMDYLQGNKMYKNRLIEAVDGEQFIELINTVSQWMGEPTQEDWEDAIVHNRFLFFDGDDAFTASFEGAGMRFSTRRNFSISWYQEVFALPHEFVAVTFTNDFIAAGQKFNAGDQVTMSGLAVWSLFNEMFNKRLRAGGSVALDIPLLFVGLGEINAVKNAVAISRAIRILRYAKAGVDIIVATGGLVMAAGLEDELTLTEDGRAALQYWTWFNLIYAGGTLTPHAITSAKGLYSSGKNLLSRPNLSANARTAVQQWMETLKDIFKKNGKNIDEVDDLNSIYSRLGELKAPARPLLENEDKLIDASKGLQSSQAQKFKDLVPGKHGDVDTKYLWTIDERGINIALEKTPFPTPRGNIVHTNLSSKAYFGGEMWFNGSNKVIINAGSGRFGDGAGATLTQWEAAIDFWKKLGYEVEAITLNAR